MDYVLVDQVYRQRLVTRDESTYPGIAAWPDMSLDTANFEVTVDGAPFAGTFTISPESEVGVHLIQIDASGLAPGSYIEIFGEYEVDANRYTVHQQVIVVQDQTDVIDSFNQKIGTPAGANLSADVAAVKLGVDGVIKSGEPCTISRTGKTNITYTKTRN